MHIEKIYETNSEQNLRIYTYFWVDMRRFVSHIYKLPASVADDSANIDREK